MPGPGKLGLNPGAFGAGNNGEVVFGLISDAGKWVRKPRRSSGQVDNFKRLVKSSYEEDMQSGSRKLDKGLSDSAKNALSMLQADELYQKEYSVFVAKVSYADEADEIQFDMALENFGKLIGFVER